MNSKNKWNNFHILHKVLKHDYQGALMKSKNTAGSIVFDI